MQLNNLLNKKDINKINDPTYLVGLFHIIILS